MKTKKKKKDDHTCDLKGCTGWSYHLAWIKKTPTAHIDAMIIKPGQKN